jgi:hypothetical protein
MTLLNQTLKTAFLARRAAQAQEKEETASHHVKNRTQNV